MAVRKTRYGPGRALEGSIGVVLFCLFAAPASAAFSGPLALPADFADTQVLGGLLFPIGLAFLPDGTLLFTEKAGLFRYLNGSVATTLLDISGRVQGGGEGGLLGIAVDPDYPARPYVYVHYTTDAVSPGKVRVSRFMLTQSGGYVQIPASSEVIWMGYGDDSASNHNGGTIRFDPLKRLVVSLGDDADECSAQDRTKAKGKLLRMRVDSGANPGDQSTLVPPDNPFSGATNVTERLTVIDGLRNPFRFDIDPVTGDYLIGDVGQGAWEEISVARPGQNMGWPYFEGNHTYRGTLCPGQVSIPPNIKPVHECAHATGCYSYIGMLSYRGTDYPNDSSFPPEYEGAFFFTDYYGGTLRAVRKNPVNGTWELVPGVSATNFGTGYSQVVEMRVGPDGAAYYLKGVNPGEIRKIAHNPPSAPEFSQALAIVAPAIAAAAALSRFPDGPRSVSRAFRSGASGR